jgi:Ni/Co efflux regulator RcnB
MRGPSFAWPRGWGYRRWHRGLIFPALFLTSAFFFDDWARIGLPPPPPGFRWVRYGPDLVLVNVVTGRVEDVAYGVFF